MDSGSLASLAPSDDSGLSSPPIPFSSHSPAIDNSRALGYHGRHRRLLAHL